MSEKVTQPTDADKLNWASDGATYSSGDPGAPKRLTGYKPKDEPVAGPGEVIPAPDFNWLNKTEMEMLDYFRQYLTRQWNQIEQGIAAGVYRDLFRVTPPAGSIMSRRLAQVFSLTGTAATGGSVFGVCGDGEQVYYRSGATLQSLIAAAPNNSNEIWESSTVTTHFASAADGLFVYISAGAGSPGLRKINRVTGAADSNGGVEFAMTQLRANGVFCVGISPNSDAGGLVFYTVATPVETGVNAVSTQLNGVAIDEDQCYVGGVRAGGNDVHAYTLASRASAWQVPLDTNAPTVNAICADGDYVYVCTDDFAIAAGGNRSLFCLGRLSGQILWSMNIGADLDDCAVDGDYLYVVTSAGLLYSIRLRGSVGVGGIVASRTNVAPNGGLYVDGISLYCQDGAAATKLRRLATTSATRGFMVVNGADPARRPFYNLAIPINNG